MVHSSFRLANVLCVVRIGRPTGRAIWMWGRYLICSGSVDAYCVVASCIAAMCADWLLKIECIQQMQSPIFTNNAAFVRLFAKVCGDSHEIFIAECEIAVAAFAIGTRTYSDFHACIHVFMYVCCGLHKMPTEISFCRLNKTATI